jgi:dodecin
MEHTYKIIEITGSSRTSIEDAVNNAITRAAMTVRELRWFEVAEIRGHLTDQKVEHYQVRLKLGFTLDEPE